MPVNKSRHVPVIACFNHAKTPLGVNFNALIAAMQIYIDKHISSAWGTPAKLVKSKGFVKGAWAIVFLDDADQPGVYAYHDLTPEGLPLSKVFVRTTLNGGDLVSVSASHELVEMLVDPGVNRMARGLNAKVTYAYEAADPVEALTFPINGIPMSNFVYPAYFESFHKSGSVKFDHLGKVMKPFEILHGGYQMVLKDGEWSQLHHPKSKKKTAAKDRRGRRGEKRRKASKGKLKHASHKSTLGKSGQRGG